jgi:oxygen-dependent protoporphyrinogen oxidase
VGGGLAGLSAAWRLRHRDIVLLESDTRTGGRLRSETRDRDVLNWGGHVFAGAGTSTEQLLHESGTATVRIPGSLSAISMKGRLLLGGPVATYPLRLPLPLPARVALIRAGTRVSADVLRYARATRIRPGESGAERQQRIYDFENDRTFAEYIGDLPPDAEALFRPTVSRSSGEPHQISAGAGIGYFSLVWNIGAGLDRSIVGGPTTLTDALAAALGDRVRRGARVDEVIQHHDHVVVRYTQDGSAHQVEARTAILATPAPVSRDIGVDLPADVRDALARVRYGSYVSAAFRTNETERQPWDDAYGIATPQRSFSVALNMGNVIRGGGKGTRLPGGSLMVFSPGSLADDLIDQDDEEILRTYLQDLDRVLPGSAAHVEEAHVQRWRLGAPYCFPGRAALQPTLTRPAGRVLLAGDYLGTLYTETAITTAFTAAERAQQILGTAASATASPTPHDTRTHLTEESS